MPNQTIPIKIIYNAVTANLVNPDRTADLVAKKVLSYKVKNYDYLKKNNLLRGWDGFNTFYKANNKSFPAGFVPHIQKNLESHGYKVLLEGPNVPPPLGPERPIVSKFPHDPRYEYQYIAVDRLVERKRMIAMVATGGGKSLIASIAYKRIGRETLFLTTRSVLMHQMKARIEEMGEPCGVIGDKEFSPVTGFNVALVQTFQAMLRDPNRARIAAKLLARYSFVILEEAHESSGDGFYEVMNLCHNAHYRLALTATPFMKDEDEDNMRLTAVAGKVGIRVMEKHLIDCGILATPIFKFAFVPKPKIPLKTKNWHEAYKSGIVENVERNAIIVDEVKRAAHYGLTSIILIQHKQHGKDLVNKLFKEGLSGSFVFGENNSTERKAAINALENKEINFLVASTIFDVGVDIPSVNLVIIAGAGKAEVAARQRIGRGLRAKKEGPNVTFILDFADDSNYMLDRHYKERRDIILATPGFAENLLPLGKDLDYSIFK